MFEYGIRGLTYGPGGISTGGQFANYDPAHKHSEVLKIEHLGQGRRAYTPWPRMELCGPTS